MCNRCPHCLTYHTRPEPYRWYEAPLALLWVQPYRCRRCGRRFLRFRGPELPLLLSSGRRLTVR